MSKQYFGVVLFYLLTLSCYSLIWL